MRAGMCLSAMVLSGALAGCGGSHMDAGLTNPGTPPPTNTVSGTVTFKGAPLAGVTVTLWSTNNNIVLSTSTTDANGNYSFSGISASGNVPLEVHLWATKTGYGFYPSVASGATVTRADHTGQFEQTEQFGVPMYFTVIDYVSLPNTSLTGANFSAYDGSNPVVSLAATGQTISYAAGDDGALQKGVAWPAVRFIDNQDGTLTDTLTGLTWLKDPNCLAAANWSNALAEAGTLANGACGLKDGSIAGQWRVPNVVEMESIIDMGRMNPALPAEVFTTPTAAVYWTSTSYFGGDEGSPNAWALRISDGRFINDSVLNSKATAMNGAMAVRGTGSGAGKLQATGLFAKFHSGDDGTLQTGVPLIFPRFIDHGDGTFTDSMTGLIWLKKADCIQGDWQTSLAQVNALASGQCGLSDGSSEGAWRMPNRNEMQSLADRNQNNEADYLDYTFLNADKSLFQSAIFLNMQPYHYYWTSTTDVAGTDEAWTVFSCDYGTYDLPKSSSGYTLAVRN